MDQTTSASVSLAKLARALKSVVRWDQRGQMRSEAEGSVYVLFCDNQNSVAFDAVAFDSVNLKDTFPGGFAFRSSTLFCIGNRVCVSDGREVAEVRIENRRADGNGYVYVVKGGERASLPTSWQQRLKTKQSRLSTLLESCQVPAAPADLNS